MSESRSFERAAFRTERFCPYHGGFILLADCYVVATSDTFNATRARRAAVVDDHHVVFDDMDLGGSGIDPADVATGSRETGGERESARPREAPRTRRRVAADLAPAVGEPVISRVDGKERIVLAPPAVIPQTQRRRRFQSEPPLPKLKSPAELAINSGGARARPARACPICLHPLPATIDYRDPYPIAMVGHTQASKTSTVLALIEQLGDGGPAALGVETFSPTEATSQYLRSLDSQIFEKFRRGTRTPRTDRVHHPPLEFVTAIGDGKPATILLHDVAGEDLMDPDARLERAPSVLWADAILFIYNPEDSPRHKRKTESGRQDQAVMLNGVRDDLESRGTHDASNRRYKDPPLIVAVSKADLLDPKPNLRGEAASPEDVQRALRLLGDGAVVSAAKRWPVVHWRFIAPQPPDGKPQGVIALFRLVLSLLDQ